MSLSAIDAALEQFCLWTWQTSLHASVLIALVLVIQFAFGKRLPVRLRYGFSLLVLLRLILPVAPATSFTKAPGQRPALRWQCQDTPALLFRPGGMRAATKGAKISSFCASLRLTILYSVSGAD